MMLRTALAAVRASHHQPLDEPLPDATLHHTDSWDVPLAEDTPADEPECPRVQIGPLDV